MKRKGGELILVASNTPADAEDLEATIDLRDYLRVISRWRTVIIIFTVVAVAVAGIFSYFFIPPVYEAKATLMVTQSEQARQQPVQEGLESVVGTVTRLPQMTVNTYVNQVTTPTVLQRVIQKLNLDPVLYTPASLAGMVNVQMVTDTNLIEIRVQNNDPALASSIANTLAQEFLAYIAETNQQQMTKSVELLQQQLQNVEQELAVATRALVEFNAQPRGVNLLEKELAKRTEDLTTYQSQLDIAGVELQQLQAAQRELEAQLAATPPTINVTQMLPPEAIAAMQLRQAGEGQAVSLSQEQLTVPVEEVNPAYTELQKALSEKAAAVADKQAEIEGLNQLVAQVGKGREKIQAEWTIKSTDQARLQRQVTQLEEAEALLAEKVTETQVAKSINLGEANLLLAAAAVAPATPVKPNKQLNMAVAGVLGLLVSVLLVFLLEYLDNTVKEAEDIERRLGLPLLGTIPEAGSRLK